jgi:glutamate carboxypeptidase
VKAAEYASSLAAELPAIVELTGRLVAEESPSDHPAGVAAVAALLGDALAEAGCDTALVAVPGSGPLLDARLELGEGPTVLVLGHTDTVWPLGTLVRWPFAADDDRLTGPGVGDMKCSLATAAHAIAALARRPPAGLGAVRLLAVPDEERGSTASRPLIEAAARDADACLVLEAARPGGGVVTARGAVGALRISARGIARHVTDPGHAAGALAPLVHLAALVEGLGDRGEGTAASVGILRGGSARQVVPGSAEMEIDLRAPTTAALDALAESVRCAARDTPRAHEVEIVVEGGTTRPAAPRSVGAATLYELAREAADELGVPIHEVRERGGSDACFPAALGVPTLDGLGPICHGSCSPQERVDVHSIATWGAILASVAAAAPSRLAATRAS